MKKLMIILLVGMLSLGLSGVAFAATTGDQTISAKINSTLTLTVPNPLSGWVLEPNTTAATGGTNTTYDNTTPSGEAARPHTALVQTNAPYTLSVKASGTATPAGEGAADVYMTTSYDDAQANVSAADLIAALQLKYNSDGSSDVPDADAAGGGANFSGLLAITTGDQQFVAVDAPASGYGYVGIEFGQTTTIGDVAYGDIGSTTTQLTYSIQLTWTAAAGLS